MLCAGEKVGGRARVASLVLGVQFEGVTWHQIIDPRKKSADCWGGDDDAPSLILHS